MNPSLTEPLWLTARHPKPLLNFLWKQGIGSERRWRLLMAACCRLIPHVAENPLARQAIDVVERHADGRADNDELDAILDAVRKLADRDPHDDFHWRLFRLASLDYGLHSRYYTAVSVLDPRSWETEKPVVSPEEHRLQCDAIRDLFGNPFRDPRKNPYWRPAPESAVIALARTIESTGAFADLAPLAAALERAGCADADMLDHCRRPGPHARGCWLIDYLLGKFLYCTLCEQNFESALEEFLRAFESVFHTDWKYTVLNLGMPKGWLESENSFLDSGANDEWNDWQNRGSLLQTYRIVKRLLTERDTLSLDPVHSFDRVMGNELSPSPPPTPPLAE